MIKKIQKSSINTGSVIFAFTLFVGVAILLIISQLYIDTKPLLQSNIDIFKKQTVAISKKVSLAKSLGKSKVGFSDKDIEKIRKQPFVKNVEEFKTANFRVSAYTNSDLIPNFQTLLFLESVPNEYLDITAEDWKWDKNKNFLPIVVPKFYLTLYNFGFAQSQSLPVVSENMLSKFNFKIKINGNYKNLELNSRVVGFSNKINSILVPENFMEWANGIYGNNKDSNPTRLLVEFKNPSDKKILKFFNENNYDISSRDLQMNKVIFYFKTLSVSVFFIGLIITLLSVALIVLSLFLIFYKNKEDIINLSLLGYTNKQISKFYNIYISVVIFVSVNLAYLVSFLVRNIYIKNFETFVQYKKPEFSLLLPLALIFMLILLVSNNFIIYKRIKKITSPS